MRGWIPSRRLVSALGLPVLFALWVWFEPGFFKYLLGLDAAMLALTGFAAFAGHVFPVWLRFRGGKGVATAAGVIIALDWRLGLAVLAAWLVVVVVTRYSSLAAIVAAVAAPAVAWWLEGPGPILVAVAAMAALIVLRHRANIAKLARGEESRIGDKKAARAPP